jgi:hypothetical protein
MAGSGVREMRSAPVDGGVQGSRGADVTPGARRGL